MRDTTIAIHHSKDNRSPDFILPLTLDFAHEREQWTGTCLELGTSTFADTLDNVRSELHAAISLQLNEVDRLGFISDYLEENRVPVIWIPDASRSSESPFTLASA